MLALITAMLWAAHAEDAAPAYDTRRFAEVLVADHQRRALRRAIRAQDIASVSVISGDGAPRRGLRHLSPAAERALLSSLTDTRPGTDLDVLVQLPGATDRVPVSVTWAGAAATVEEGPRWDGARPAMTRAAFQQRWGMRLESDGQVDWGETDLGLLDMALSRLSAAELARVRALPLRRVSQPPEAHNGRTASAAYAFSIEGVRLSFYDLDSDARRTIFCGTPDAPVPMEVWTILHELGHAIGRAEVHQPALPVLPLVRRVDRLFASVERLRAQPDAPGLGEATGDYLAALRALEEAGFTASGWNDYQQTLDRPSAAELALAEILRGHRPVTWYAAAGPGEAFAELFALWHIEPAQLRRHVPAAADWFERGAHLWGVSPGSG